MATIAMVYKSGGDYTSEDVKRLRDSIVKNVTHSYSLVCLTDVPEELDFNILTVKLRRNFTVTKDYKGWWAKLEVFNLIGKVIYLDLDTILTSNADWMFQMVQEMGKFYMLSDFYRGTPASGIMAWHGNFQFINDKPLYNPRSWDQHYINRRLQHYKINLIQSEFSGVYSYKVHCRENGIPLDAKVICFHGKPRLKEVNYLEEELDELLRKRQSSLPPGQATGTEGT